VPASEPDPAVNRAGAPASSDAERTELSYQRTLMSHERTLMAWVRTSLSMTTFGFSLFSFFQYVRAEGGASTGMLLGPRHFALILVGLGTIALGAASVAHYQAIRRLHSTRSPARSLALIVAVLVVALGAAAFVSVLVATIG